MAEYVGSAAPAFKISLNFAQRWPSDARFSMVDRVILEFPTQDGCSKVTVEAWIANSAPYPGYNAQERQMYNRISTSVKLLDIETGTSKILRNSSTFISYNLG